LLSYLLEGERLLCQNTVLEDEGLFVGEQLLEFRYLPFENLFLFLIGDHVLDVVVPFDQVQVCLFPFSICRMLQGDVGVRKPCLHILDFRHLHVQRLRKKLRSGK